LTHSAASSFEKNLKATNRPYLPAFASLTMPQWSVSATTDPNARQTLQVLCALLSFFVLFSHQRSHFLLEGRQIGFKNSPDDVIGNRSVTMDETIAEGDDSARVTYSGRETGIEAEA